MDSALTPKPLSRQAGEGSFISHSLRLCCTGEGLGMRAVPASLIVLTSLFILAISGCTSHQASNSPGPDYYPLAVGNVWTYKLSPGTLVYKAQVTASRRVDNVTTYAMAVNQSYSFLAERPDGVYEYGEGDPDQPTNATLFSPPILVYQLPFTVGAEWDYPALSDPQDPKSQEVYISGTVDDMEDVTVPAGTFHECYHLTVDDPRQAPADRTELWFAPNVGIVKTVTYIVIGRSAPKTSTTELVSYKKAS